MRLFKYVIIEQPLEPISQSVLPVITKYFLNCLIKTRKKVKSREIKRNPFTTEFVNLKTVLNIFYKLCLLMRPFKLPRYQVRLCAQYNRFRFNDPPTPYSSLSHDESQDAGYGRRRVLIFICYYSKNILYYNHLNMTILIFYIFITTK